MNEIVYSQPFAGWEFTLAGRNLLGTTLKAVFQTKVSPAYDDVPEQFYHFPRTYLNQVKEAVGDWIVYYEPRRSTGDNLSRGGRLAYFAVAQIVGLRDDPNKPDHYYADIANYLDFDKVVPFREGDFYYEAALKAPDGRPNQGQSRRAVRNMSDHEFEMILRAGFSTELGPAKATATTYDPVSYNPGFAEPQADFSRPLVKSTITRPFRDAAFARQIQFAYSQRCAMTGLRIINGGGRAEAQAAHIRPVASAGPRTPFEMDLPCRQLFIGCLIADLSRLKMISRFSKPRSIFPSRRIAC